MEDSFGACSVIATHLKLVRNYASSNPTQTGWHAFGNIFQLKPNQRLEIVRKRNRLLSVFADAAREADLLPFKSSLYRDWLTPVEKGLALMPLESPVNQSTAWLTPALVQQAEATAELVASENRSKQIDTNQVQELIEQIKGLEADVLAWADQETSQIQRWLLDQLRMIREALEDIQLTGVAPVKTALNATWGSVMTDRSVWEWLTASDRGKILKNLLVTIFLVVAPVEYELWRQLPTSASSPSIEAALDDDAIETVFTSLEPLTADEEGLENSSPGGSPPLD